MEVIRFDDKVVENLVVRQVYGLNIFSANGIKTFDPVFRFITHVSSLEGCYLFIGGLCLNDFVDNIEEIGFPTDIEIIPCTCELYNGMFYNQSENGKMDVPPSLLISYPSTWAFDHSAQLLTYAVSCDSVALVKASSPSQKSAIKQAFNTSVSNHFEQVQRLCEASEFVVLTSYDGDYVEIWTTNVTSFAKVDEALSLIQNEIKARPEYILNHANAYWDEKNSLCLKFQK